MNRRELVLASGAWAALASARLEAQAAPKRIAWLGSGTAAGQSVLVDAFKSRLKELGLVEGRDYIIEFRWIEAKPERVLGLARELIALKPAVIVTGGSAAVKTLKNETATIPVVFGSVGDPVEQGFVKSLSRPGANITGVTIRTEANNKLLDIVRETLPKARRIAVLEHEGEPATKIAFDGLQRAAAGSGLELGIVRVKSADDFAQAFAEAARRKSDAVLAMTFALFGAHARKIAELAVKERLPLFGGFQRNAEEGALVSYSADLRDNYRRAAVLVDKIFKGANPGELPIELPDRFSLIINLRTARALGITVPQPLLARADEVIE